VQKNIGMRVDWFIFVTLLLSVLFLGSVGVLGWFQFIDGTYFRPPIEFESRIFQLTKCWYVPGETVQAHVKFRKNRDISGRVKWNLLDNRLFEFTPRMVSLPVGEYDMLIDICKLPEHMPATGPEEMWKFMGIAEYQVNPIKVVSYALETTEFVILGKEQK
jgi:hypothetical protein